MKPGYKRFFIWLAVALWMFLIFCLSAQTAPRSSLLSGQTIRKVAEFVRPGFPDLPREKQDRIVADLQHIARKIAHMLIYMILGVLCMAALFQHSLGMKSRFIFAIAICTSYIITDEVHQLFVHGRGGQIGDVFIDLCGALSGGLVVVLVNRVWDRGRYARDDPPSSPGASVSN